MLSATHWFKVSCYSVGLAVLTVLSVPVGCALTSRDNSGWDYLSDDIRFLTASALLLAVFSAIALFSGLRALKQRRIAALWVVPLSIIFLVIVGYSFFGLYIYLFDPYGAS